MVDNITFQKTIIKIKKDLSSLSLDTKRSSKLASKTVVINATQLWTLKLFHILYIIAKYLQVQKYNVKILIDDGFLEHIDMIKENDEISVSEIKQRSIFAAKELLSLDVDLIVPYSKFLSKENISITKKQKDILVKQNSTNIEYSTFRYFGKDKINSNYEENSIHNLIIGDILAKECYKKWTPISFITLAHMNKYSFSSFYKYLTSKNVSNVSIGLPMCGYKKNGIEIFSKIDIGYVMQKIMTNLIINKSKKQTINNFFTDRFLYKNTQNIQNIQSMLQKVKSKGKKIVAIFPNIFQDATWEEYNSCFNSIEEWFIETVKYLKENNYFIIIKAHPNELKWNVSKSSVDYISDMIDDNFLILKNNSKVPSYALFDYIDLVVVYNGTLLMEAMYKDIPVIAGGNSYILEGIFNNITQTKTMYFSLFEELTVLKQKQINKKDILFKYIYFDFFCREVYIKFLNHNLPYPHIDIDIVKKILQEDDLSLDLIMCLIDKDKDFDFNKYTTLFEIN